MFFDFNISVSRETFFSVIGKHKIMFHVKHFETISSMSGNDFNVIIRETRLDTAIQPFCNHDHEIFDLHFAALCI